MARVIGTATVQIKADTSQFRSAVNGLGSGLTSGFGKLKGLIAGIGLGHLAGEALRFGAEYRIQLDNAKAAVDGLTDSEAEAAKLMDDMVKLAINTPFDLPGVQDATIRLLAYGEGFGITSDNVTQYVRTIGNAAAATGKGADAMNNTITVMGKISGQGRVMTRDLNALTANFPSLHPWEILSEMTGKSVSELRRLSILPGGLSGVVDATQFIEELTAAMEDLPGASADWEGLAKATGKSVDELKALDEEGLMKVFRQFPDMADAMGRKMFTLGGSIEVFKDTMGVAVADALIPFFATLQLILGDPAILAALKTLAATFGLLASTILDELGPVLPDLVLAFSDILTALMPAAPAIGNIAMMFALMLVAMTPLIEQLAKLATTITDWLMTLDPTLLGYITAALLVFYLVGFGWIPLLIAAVVLLAMFIAKNWQYIADAAKEYTAMIVQAWQWLFDNVIEPVKNFVLMIVDFFIMLYDWLVGNSIIPDLVEAIVGWFKKLWDFIVSIFTGIWNFFVSIWNAIWNTIMSVVTGIVNWLANAWNSIKSKASELWNGIKNTIANVVTAIKDKIAEIWNAIKQKIVDIVNGIKDKLSDIWNSIKTAVTDKFNAIKTAASDKWNQIKTAITDKVTQAKDTVKGIIDDIVGFFSDLPSRIMRGLGNIASSIADALTPDLPGPIGSAVGAVVGWLHADGGVFSRPHLGMVAERGPEAIIPLSNPMRAMAVMQQAGLDRMAGMMGQHSGISGPLISMPGAVIQDATDADLVAQRTLVAMTAAMVA